MNTSFHQTGQSVTEILSNRTASEISRIQQSPQDKGEKECSGLKKACQDFEAMFLYNLLQQMRRSIPESGLFGSSHQKKMITSMFDMEVAGAMAHGKGIGLGDQFFQQIQSREDYVKSTREAAQLYRMNSRR